MTDEKLNKAFEEGARLRDLESEIKTASERFKNPATSNFVRDSLMTITTQNYREYLRLAVIYQVPTRELKSVAEIYLGMINELIEREKLSSAMT